MRGVKIEIKDLRAGYGEKDILNGLNLVIESGDIVSICGPNGAGKTTLFKSVSSYLKPNSGTISIDGKSLTSYRTDQLSKTIAVVKQQIIPAKITLFDYISMGRFPYFKPFQFFRSRDDKEKAEHYIHLTKLDHLKYKMLDEVSGGERQLAQIAKALCQEPKLLLLDEPISSLDISHQVQIMDLIRMLNREFKFTVLFILHDLNLASEYSDKIAILSGGEVTAYDTPARVLTFETIEKVYNTPVIVEKSSLSGKPLVIPVPKDYINQV
jgi:iron complex transport system ATP-binding protein